MNIRITPKYIKKTGKKQRKIVVCPADLKKNYYKLYQEITQIFLAQPLSKYAHGFIPKRSPITNAKAHLNYMYSVSFDIKDYFDHIRHKHIKPYLDQTLIDQTVSCFSLPGAPQGLPSSPAVANVAGLSFSKDFYELLKMENVSYTYYADDLTFSFNDYSMYGFLKDDVKSVLKKHGFSLNTKKTKLQSSKWGRRIITGVGIEGYKVYPTRKARRILRVLKHQQKQLSVQGMESWMKSIK